MLTLLVSFLLLPVAASDAKKEELDRLVKELGEKDEKAIEALQELSRYGADVKPALPAIIKVMKDGKPELRREATRTLSVLATHAVDAVPALIEALGKDKEAKVRSYAAFAFKTMGRDAKAAIPALIEALKDKDDEVRCVTADALGRMGEDARPAILALGAALKDTESGPHAAKALGTLGAELAKPALPALADALRSQNDTVRGQAAQTLAQLGALEPLARAVEDKDEDVRIDAVVALKSLGKAAVPALKIALKDKSADVRLNTANVLGMMGDAAAGAAVDLAGLVKDANQEVRIRAALALAAIGPDAKDALPLLKAASKDEKVDRIREAIQFAIDAVMKKE